MVDSPGNRCQKSIYRSCMSATFVKMEYFLCSSVLHQILTVSVKQYLLSVLLLFAFPIDPITVPSCMALSDSLDPTSS